MAEQKSRLVIEISTENAKRNAQALGRELRSIEKNGTYASKSMDSLSISARKLATQMAGIVTVGAAISKMDMFSNLQNRLKLVTQSQTELNRAMNDTFTIAQKSYASWDSVVQVYQRFSDNAKRLKIDMTQTAALTETVSKAVAISGASTQAAEAALTQFGQALASGVLRGEELNSIMEQTPALSKAIAEGMGITVGQLRSVAAEGKITGDVLVDALTKAKGSVDELFAKTDVTIGQSLTQLSNEVTKFTGEAGKGSGAASALASSIQSLSNNFNTFANLGIAVTIGYITTVLAKKTAVLAKSTATWSANTKAIIANNIAENALTNAKTRTAVAGRVGLGVGRALLGVLGGPVGLGVTVASVAAGYLLMKDNGDEVNEMLKLQAKYSDKAAEELKKLAGNDKTNATSGLVKIFEQENKELEKSEEAIKAVLFAIRATSVENEKARAITEKARRGTISYTEAINLLNNEKIPLDLYEKLKQQANQYDENSLKAGKTKKQLAVLGKQVELTGNAVQNASLEHSKHALSLDDTANAAQNADTKLQAYFQTLKSQDYSNYLTIGFLNQGYSVEQAEALSKSWSEAFVTDSIISKEQEQQILKSVALEKQKNDLIDQRNQKEQKQTKELKDQGKILKLNALVTANAAKANATALETANKLPRGLLSSVNMVESPNSNSATSKAGAGGPMQFMPDTADHYKVDIKSVESSYRGASNYLKDLLKMFDGDLENALRAYNWGQGHMQNYLKYGSGMKKAKGKWQKGYFADRPMPKETREYSGKVMSYMAGASGHSFDSNFTINDYLEELQKAKAAQLKTQQEIDEFRERYSNTDVVRNKKRTSEITNAEKLGLLDLIPQINARYDAQDELSRLQFESQVYGWQWVGEEKIKNEAKVNKAVIIASKDLSDQQKAAHKKSIDEQAEYALAVFRETQRQKINELAFAVGGAGDQARNYLMERSNPSLYARNQLSSEQFGAQSQLNTNYQSQRGEIFNQGLDPEEQHAKLLEAEKQFLDSKQVLNEMYAQKETDLQQSQYQNQLQIWGSLLSQGQTMWSQLTQSVKNANGEQSGAYKTMFLAQQAFSMGSAYISAVLAAQQVAADATIPFFGAKIAASSAMMAMGMANVGLIAAQTIAGFSGGGYTGSGGKFEPAGIVHKGEVVFSQADIARWGGVGVVEALRKGQRGYSDGGVVHDTSSYIVDRYKKITEKKSEDKVQISQTIIINSDGSAKVDTQGQRQLAQGFQNMMESYTRKEMRQGGLIYNFVRGS